MATFCKICQSRSEFLFETMVLSKFMVKYYQCTICSFIQTEEPYWLNEAYVSPIASLDVGLLQRNNMLAHKIPTILNFLVRKNGKYLDYGGGYGIFVRLMRDNGYDFYLSDKYAQNLFAKYFELDDSGLANGFDCLTAFELFEHLKSPVSEIEEMFKLSDTLIFSTEIQPAIKIRSVNDWWYFVPEGGQHVSFYSLDSLEQLRRHFDCYLYTNKSDLHILSKNLLHEDPFTRLSQTLSWKRRALNIIFKQKPDIMLLERESLLAKDFEYYKTKLENGND